MASLVRRASIAGLFVVSGTLLAACGQTGLADPAEVLGGDEQVDAAARRGSVQEIGDVLAQAVHADHGPDEADTAGAGRGS